MGESECYSETVAESSPQEFARPWEAPNHRVRSVTLENPPGAWGEGGARGGVGNSLDPDLVGKSSFRNGKLKNEALAT